MHGRGEWRVKLSSRADGGAARVTSDGSGSADPPAGAVAALRASPSSRDGGCYRAYIAFSISAISTKAKPTELSAMP
jgi:hypothetical protein